MNIIKGIIAIILLMGGYMFGKSADQKVTPDSPSDTSEISNTTTSIAPVEPIGNTTVDNRTPEQVTINEIRLVRDALLLLTRTSWNGGRGDLPISYKDFDSEKLEEYMRDEASKKDKLTIPSSEEDAYISRQSVLDVNALLLQAHNEYIAYLKSKNVSERYINELLRVLPADSSRLTYHGINDPSADPTATEPFSENGVKDYSRLVMNMYAVDVYNAASHVIDSRILGSFSGKTPDEEYLVKARNMGVRYLMYHEMTHALQQAYTNLHVEKQEDRVRKSSYVYATKNLFDVDKRYFWKWAGKQYAADSGNRKINDESQSEGVSYEMLTNVYGLSTAQKKLLWDFLFGRLESMQRMTKEIQTLFESRYPDILPDTFGTQLSTVFDNYPTLEGRRSLANIATKFDGVPAYVGYLNPMRPEHAHLFWNALKN